MENFAENFFQRRHFDHCGLLPLGHVLLNNCKVFSNQTNCSQVLFHYRLFTLLICFTMATMESVWSLQCDSDSNYAVTPYLHYPTPQDCSVLTASYAPSQCNYHCRQACANALGLSTVPDLSVVSSTNAHKQGHVYHLNSLIVGQ